MYDPSEIFLVYFADICEAIEVKPLHIVNRLLSANFISSNFKDDVQSMSGDNYEKADKVVNELQRQVQEKGINFLKAICNFLLKQNNILKDIGMKMKLQLESEIIFYNFIDYRIIIYNINYFIIMLHNVTAYLMMLSSSNQMYDNYIHFH